jgi:SOS-response transcriptional repressor LexA
MRTVVAHIATDARGIVANLQTDVRGEFRYAAGMMDLWIQEALQQSGLSQSELARRLTEKLGRSIDRAAVNKMAKGTRNISGEEMLAIEALTGHPAPTAGAGQISVVPQISWVSASAMRPEAPVSVSDAVSFIAVPELPPGKWIALEVQGDSMDRVSPDGSIIFVNCSDQRLVNGKFYVFEDAHDHGTTYKRFRSNPDRFVPYSTNPDHEPIYPDGEFRVIGRVWRTHKDL